MAFRAVFRGIGPLFYILLGPGCKASCSKSHTLKEDDKGIMRASVNPRGSKYLKFEASGSKNHSLNGIWDQRLYKLGTWTLSDNWGLSGALSRNSSKESPWQGVAASCSNRIEGRYAARVAVNTAIDRPQNARTNLSP